MWICKRFHSGYLEQDVDFPDDRWPSADHFREAFATGDPTFPWACFARREETDLIPPADIFLQLDQLNCDHFLYMEGPLLSYSQLVTYFTMPSFMVWSGGNFEPLSKPRVKGFLMLEFFAAVERTLLSVIKAIGPFVKEVSPPPSA